MAVVVSETIVVCLRFTDTALRQTETSTKKMSSAYFQLIRFYIYIEGSLVTLAVLG